MIFIQGFVCVWQISNYLWESCNLINKIYILVEKVYFVGHHSLDCDPAGDLRGGELHHEARHGDGQHPGVRAGVRLVAGVGRKCRDLKKMEIFAKLKCYCLV